MSLALVLTPMAVAMAVTASAGGVSLAQAIRTHQGKSVMKEMIPTKYMDCELLKKALEDCGTCVDVISENSLRVTCNGGVLIYARDYENEPFKVMVADVESQEELAQDLEALEYEYNMNVQQFTYDKVIKNLPKNMHLTEESVLEDDSMLMTITIDD